MSLTGITVSHTGVTVSHTGVTVSHTGVTVSHIGVTVSHTGVTVSHTGVTVSHTGLTVSHTGVVVSHTGVTVSHTGVTARRLLVLLSTRQTGPQWLFPRPEGATELYTWLSPAKEHHAHTTWVKGLQDWAGERRQIPEALLLNRPPPLLNVKFEDSFSPSQKTIKIS